ncbi:hypothetical protein Lal_00046108 [Lupinus albus]|uniref:Uncharacterized protein n=1 Tax=Lupinus albus TaxID=3870 RepID=A0A6A5NTU9_LUPAL|nr:hypothetical protein Lalb_Chr14g0368471 [Lupinus albus]KAF1886870.1 hypothetical protein Lal_00046108 [Lupinus albus]
MAPPLFLRQVLLHRLRLRLTFAPPHRLWCSAATPAPPSSSENVNEKPSSALTSTSSSNLQLKTNDPLLEDDVEWKVKEAEILRDIEPIVMLTRNILFSRRYMDGELLNVEDEKAIVERLLAYHPHYEDKIGCGLESIMVDRHPQFVYSRGLFVVRIDGVWIHFSHQNCLREYIRYNYPIYAERFIEEHLKYGMRFRKIHQYPT